MPSVDIWYWIHDRTLWYDVHIVSEDLKCSNIDAMMVMRHNAYGILHNNTFRIVIKAFERFVIWTSCCRYVHFQLYQTWDVEYEQCATVLCPYTCERGSKIKKTYSFVATIPFESFHLKRINTDQIKTWAKEVVRMDWAHNNAHASEFCIGKFHQDVDLTVLLFSVRTDLSSFVRQI